MTEHELKTWPYYFDAIAREEKTFEVRRDDRGYQKGDTLRLRRFDPRKRGPSQYTGDEITVEVKYILTGGQLGIEPGFVVMGIEVKNG